MSQADVAVVVPVFNRANAVLETLASVVRQTVLPRRLIVVDDGSTDGTAASVRAWIARTKPPFEAFVVEQTNQGAGAARNRGFREMGGCKYVAFLDSDDHWPQDFLARAVARMEANGAAVAATSDRVYHRLWKQRLGQRSSKGLERGATAWLLMSNSGIASCTLFRAWTVRRLGGYDPTFPTGQDVEFFLRASLEGPWLHVPGDPVQFYVGFTTAQGEASNLSMKYADRQKRWVRIRERFIFRLGGRGHVSPAFYKRLFAHRWHKTAAVYQRQGRLALAIACYRKALTYRPMRVWTILRLTKLEIGRTVARLFGVRQAARPTSSASAPAEQPAAKRIAA
jgi:glycosyltransferase involved in cell wall biosynthesis